MAHQFLKSTALPPLTSKVYIHKGLNRSRKFSVNSTIKSITVKDHFISIIYSNQSLPFPLGEDQQIAQKLVSFEKDLNQTILKVASLKSGNCKLSLDTIEFGIFGAEQFRKGINLAVYNTPQRLQAQLIKNKLTALWKVEADLRSIRHVELNQLKGFKGFNDLNQIKADLDSVYKNKFEGNTYFKTVFDKYIINKPKESELTKQLEKIRTDVYYICIIRLRNMN